MLRLDLLGFRSPTSTQVSLELMKTDSPKISKNLGLPYIQKENLKSTRQLRDFKHMIC